MTTFRHLLANPIFRDHGRLVLGWSDDQLWAIAYLLAPYLPAGLGWRMVLAVAAVARSIVIEERLTGNGVHYSRRKENYSIPDRYAGADPRSTYHYVTGAMDILIEAGLITHEMGKWDYRRESTAWATGDLVMLIGDLCDTTEPREISAPAETIVLRDRADKKPLDYEDTAETVAMREQAAKLNEALAATVVLQFGKRMAIPVGRRIFNGDFGGGGRFYCKGPSHQNMRERDRLDLKVVADGDPRPVVEFDYSEQHIRMAYAKAGVPAPAGDLYRIPGYDRGAVKIATNITINAGTTASAMLAAGAALRDDDALREASGLPAGLNAWGYTSFTAGLITAIKNRHHKIRDVFNSDAGVRFQRADSDMAVEVMLEMIEITGRCPLPVHDSFLVADVDADDLRRVMKRVARRRGLPLQLKEKRAVHTTIEDLSKAGSPLVPARPG